MKHLIDIGTGLLLIFLLASCHKVELEVDVTDCIENKIRKIKKEKVQNPPAQVWEWKIDGKTFYYLTSDCCDRFNLLYDQNCSVVCAPDGGLSGRGDGSCPEFTGEIEKKLLWEDERK